MTAEAVDDFGVATSSSPFQSPLQGDEDIASPHPTKDPFETRPQDRRSDGAGGAGCAGMAACKSL